MKATLANAGPGGIFYHDFHAISVREINQHIVLYFFCDPEPSPQIENKFRPQQEDKVHGNDFIYTSFGPNAGRRHRHFKALFTCQDPDIDPPNRSLYLNLRVRPMLMWLKLFLPLVWLLRLAFSVDDMIMGFNFKHKDKLRIMYTNEGGGFQADTLC